MSTFLDSNFSFTILFIKLYKIDAIGILIIIPKKPYTLPPINTASIAHNAGSPTEPPTILG